MDRREQARQALELYDGEVMKGVWAKAEATFISEWKNADTVERREAAHAKIVGVAEVRRLLRTIIQAGEYGHPD